MRKYNAVIWDLDGTLLYTLEDLKNSVNYALEKLSYPTRTLEQTRQSVGNGVRVLMALSIPNGRDNPNYERAYDLFCEHYAIHSKDNTYPYKGIRECIKVLADNGIRQAIVSNKINPGVQALNDEFFGVDVALGQQEGLKRKPYPDMVWKAMKDLGVNKQETVYIGDSEVDIETAKNSGLDSISVLWGFRSKEEIFPYNPMRMVESPAELVNILLEL